MQVLQKDTEEASEVDLQDFSDENDSNADKVDQWSSEGFVK